MIGITSFAVDVRSCCGCCESIACCCLLSYSLYCLACLPTSLQPLYPTSLPPSQPTFPGNPCSPAPVAIERKQPPVPKGDAGQSEMYSPHPPTPECRRCIPTERLGNKLGYIIISSTCHLAQTPPRFILSPFILKHHHRHHQQTKKPNQARCPDSRPPLSLPPCNSSRLERSPRPPSGTVLKS